MAGRAPRMIDFYARRITRLEPPYIIVLAICFIPLYIFNYKPENAPSFYYVTTPLWASAMASLVYAHGLLFRSPSRLNPPAWSLEIEFQFYILSPLLFRMLRSTRSLTWTITCCVVSSVVLMAFSRELDVITGDGGLQRWTVIYYAYPFLTGIAASAWAHRNLPFVRSGLVLADFAFAFGLLGLAASGRLERIDYGFWVNFADDLLRMTCVVMIFFGAARGILARRLLASRPISLVGGMVYSLYLVHVPVLQALSGPLLRTLAHFDIYVVWASSLLVLSSAALVVAAAFYLLVEKPCMDPSWPRKLLRLAPGRQVAA